MIFKTFVKEVPTICTDSLASFLLALAEMKFLFPSFPSEMKEAIAQAIILTLRDPPPVELYSIIKEHIVRLDMALGLLEVNWKGLPAEANELLLKRVYF